MKIQCPRPLDERTVSLVLAGKVGLEPTTISLTGSRSTIELLSNVCQLVDSDHRKLMEREIYSLQELTTIRNWRIVDFRYYISKF